MPDLTYEIYHDDNSIHVVNPNEITARHLHLTHTPSQQIASLDQAPSPISKLLFEEEPQRLRRRPSGPRTGAGSTRWWPPL